MFQKRKAWKEFIPLPAFGKRNTTNGNSPQSAHPPGHSVRTVGVQRLDLKIHSISCFNTTTSPSRHHPELANLYRLEAFAATKLNEIFSGRQPRQDVKVFRRFRK
jgi:hypothetical protein